MGMLFGLRLCFGLVIYITVRFSSISPASVSSSPHRRSGIALSVSKPSKTSMSQRPPLRKGRAGRSSPPLFHVLCIYVSSCAVPSLSISSWSGRTDSMWSSCLILAYADWKHCLFMTVIFCIYPASHFYLPSIDQSSVLHGLGEASPHHKSVGSKY